MTPSAPTNSVYTGSKQRTRQGPLYDSYSVASGSNVNPNLTLKMFGNINGNGSTGPDTTNMQDTFKLTNMISFNVQSLRLVLFAAAADIASFCTKTCVYFNVGGIKLLEAPPEYWPGGAGCSGSASNGVNDPRAIVPFNLDPILITEGMSFNVTLVASATFAATAAFFLRAYLDGEITEPV